MRGWRAGWLAQIAEVGTVPLTSQLLGNPRAGFTPLRMRFMLGMREEEEEWRRRRRRRRRTDTVY